MRRKLSAVLAVVLVLSLCFGMAACGPKEEAPAGGGEGGGLIGVSMPTKSLERWNNDGANMKAQLEAKGFEVDLQYGDGAQPNDVPTQVSQIENMITKECQVIVIAAIDGFALVDVLQQAADAGIKVIAYDRLIYDTDNYDYYATFDNYGVGQIQGNYIKDKLDLDNAAGPFNMEVFAGDPGDSNAVFFYQGAIDALKPYIDSGKLVVKSGQLDRATVAINGWKAETAQARMDNLLTANYADGSKLDVVLSPNDSLAQGIVASLDNNGYGTADKPYPVVTGQDGDVLNVINIIDGKQSMSIFKDTRVLAEKVVGMVEALLAGTEPEVNDTTTYDNNVKVVPSYLCTPQFLDVSNFKEVLESGYYSAENAGKIEDAAKAKGLM